MTFFIFLGYFLFAVVISAIIFFFAKLAFSFFVFVIQNKNDEQQLEQGNQVR